MITFGSLFAGIGGFDLGFERMGLHCAWQVEINNKCNEVLAHHWPDVQRYGDVKDVGRRNLESVDLICGGFPCQGLSVAGRRAGLADERSGLWWEFHRIINELRPRWVVIENVPGLLSSWSPTEPPPSGVCAGTRWEVEETSDLEAILTALAELGYEWAYRIFDAQYDRVAQRRRRVFIIGHTRDVGGLEPASSKQNVSRLASLPVKVLFESSSVRWDTAPSRKTQSDITASVKASSPSRRGGGSWPITEEFIIQHALSGHNQRNDPDGEHFVVAFPGMAQAGAGWAPPSMPIDEDKTGPLDTKRAHCVAFTHSGYSNKPAWITGDRTDAIPAAGHHPSSHQGIGIIQAVARPLAHGQTTDHYDESQQTYVTAWNWQSGGDVRHSFGLPNLQANQVPAVGVRRLTPTECERLQGFPDGWTAVNGMKDTARYRMLGNAVCVPVAEWIGKRIRGICV